MLLEACVKKFSREPAELQLTLEIVSGKAIVANEVSLVVSSSLNFNHRRWVVRIVLIGTRFRELLTLLSTC